MMEKNDQKNSKKRKMSSEVKRKTQIWINRREKQQENNSTNRRFNFFTLSYNKMYNTLVSETHPCLSLSFLFLFSTSLSDPAVYCTSSCLTPCPLDTSGVKLEQLHLQHKGLPSLPHSASQIKTHILQSAFCNPPLPSFLELFL